MWIERVDKGDEDELKVGWVRIGDWERRGTRIRKVEGKR